eukprot:Lithocolla_globosa_v1_NODE_1678_length_2402_cov_33.350660.p5 type:complete len:105 gc:universal NODE_1678_length_2402_cov_33.350660:684-998(+)
MDFKGPFMDQNPRSNPEKGNPFCDGSVQIEGYKTPVGDRVRRCYLRTHQVVQKLKTQANIRFKATQVPYFLRVLLLSPCVGVLSHNPIKAFHLPRCGHLKCTIE